MPSIPRSSPPYLQVAQCVDHLNQLRSKAKTQRDAGTAMAIIGGVGSIGAGTVSAAVSDQGASSPSAKSVLAGIAAGNAVVALVGHYIGNPSDTLVDHAKRWGHYRKLNELLLDASPDNAKINAAAMSCVSPDGQ